MQSFAARLISSSQTIVEFRPYQLTEILLTHTIKQHKSHLQWQNAHLHLGLLYRLHFHNDVNNQQATYFLPCLPRHCGKIVPAGSYREGTFVDNLTAQIRAPSQKIKPHGLIIVSFITEIRLECCQELIFNAAFAVADKLCFSFGFFFFAFCRICSHLGRSCWQPKLLLRDRVSS